MAKINGFKLQQAIREQFERKNLAEGRFEGSLKAFPEEKKPDPIKVMEEYEDAEKRIAFLQAAQDKYNLAVAVEVPGFGKMSLHDATKLVGGAKRVADKWKNAASENEDRYSRVTVRERDSILAQRQIESEKCVELAKAAAKKVRDLRFAIQKGNATEIDMTIELGLD